MKSLASKDLLTFFQTQAKIRISELYVAKRYPEEKMKCPMHMCVGQESIAAALGLYSRLEDIFMGNYRSHGHYIAKGGNIRKLFAEILGRTDGCSGGYGGSMHIFDESVGFYGASAIVAGTVPISMGLGLSVKYKKEDRIVVGFFGDGAVEEGVMYETLSFAKLLKLPVIFVCENNRLAVETPIELRSPTFNLSERFASFGVNSAVIETLDIESMLSKTSEVLDRVRVDRTPFFLEYRVNRFASHVGPAFKGPVDAWWQDPHKPNSEKTYHQDNGSDRRSENIYS